MTYRTAFPLLAFLVAGGCGGGDATSPIAPNAASVAATSRGSESGQTNSPRSGALYVTKNCAGYTGLAGQSCTITSSTLKEIPIGSLVVYESARDRSSLNSNLTLYPAGRGNQVAFGHVVLNLATGAGVVTFSGGTGKFKKFEAAVDVSIKLPEGRPNFVWDGTYSFGSEQHED